MRGEFFNLIRDCTLSLKDVKKPIRIISHYDTDGITSASILIKALEREKKKFVVSNVKGLTEDLAKELSKEDYQNYLFVDLGSGSLDLIEKYLGNKEVIVLDHHIVNGSMKGKHVNPLDFGLDENEISAAGLAYLFVKELNSKNVDLAYLAIVGAIGDQQENKGFHGLNEEILEDAKNKIEIQKGLRMFGIYTRPLHKVLQYSTDPYIPGVTGNEQGALEFLKKTGIDYIFDNEVKKLIHLSDEDVKKLVSSIIIERQGKEENAEDVLGNIYLLKNEDESIKDAREFATLLNCCGRLDKTSLGVGVCLGSKKLKEKAFDLLKEYRGEIVKGLNWFYDNRGKNVFEGKGFVVVNSGDNIKSSMIGVIIGIISSSNVYPKGMVLIGMANGLDFVKVSLRSVNSDLDLRDLLKEVSRGIEIEYGGHAKAAGAMLKEGDEEKFIENIKGYFERRSIEEKIK